MPVTAHDVPAPESAFRFLARGPQYASPTKANNYYRLVEADREGRLTVDAAPLDIRIEPHASCNLRCCWAHRDPRHPALRPRGAMSLDLVRRIIDEVGEYLYSATLCHWGEPTLNRQLPEIVRLFHDADIYTTFHTNMNLVDAAYAAALVDAGLDFVSASIDGVSQSVYETYRKGGNVERALGGLRHMIEQRERLGRTTPQVRWQYLVFPHNECEYPAAKALAAEIGVDKFDAFGHDGRQWTPEAGFVPRDAKPTACSKSCSSTPAQPAGLLCYDPWRRMAVDWDGAVHICCASFQAKYVVGHMSEHGLREIFNHSRYQAVRRVIRDGVWHEGDGPIACTGCYRLKHALPQIAALNHFNRHLD